MSIFRRYFGMATIIILLNIYISVIINPAQYIMPMDNIICHSPDIESGQNADKAPLTNKKCHECPGCFIAQFVLFAVILGLFLLFFHKNGLIFKPIFPPITRFTKYFYYAIAPPLLLQF